MDKYVLGMYDNEDQLDNNDRLLNKFLDIFVLNPRTHIKRNRAVYTDYEIHVKTNHPEFAIKDSHVRRRYSEFVWLKSRLGINDIMMTTAPSLPGKKYFGRFKDPFLKKRQMGLQSFMNKVVEVNPFLSDPALHLFLQTDLSISQMESYLKHGVLLSNIRDRVIAEQKIREQRRKVCDSERTCTNHTCSLKKSLSLDAIISLKKEESLVVKETGRGWSNFIGGTCYNHTTSDRDSHYMFGNVYSQMNQPHLKTTARVLPGGQLQLPDDQTDFPQESSTNFTPRPRPASWHGKTLDIIDYFLDSYDVIDAGSSSHVDSMSVSHNSIATSSGGQMWHATDESTTSGSDDGIEIDIDERLSEYTIISTTPPSLFEIPDFDSTAMTKKYDNKDSLTTSPLNFDRKLEKKLSSSTLQNNLYEDGGSVEKRTTYQSESTFNTPSGFHHSGSFEDSDNE